MVSILGYGKSLRDRMDAGHDTRVHKYKVKIQDIRVDSS